MSLQSSGSKFIASSQRPDGSWRKERRVKEGYVPQEEVPIYMSKGKQWRQERDSAPIPGLVSTPLASQTRKSKAHKQTADRESAPVVSNSDKTSGKCVSRESDHAFARNQFGQPLTTDPTKRLRNLKKKLRDIESLKKKDRKSLEKEQLEKISKEAEIVALIEELEGLLLI